jgi:hypothetical protein
VFQKIIEIILWIHIYALLVQSFGRKCFIFWDTEKQKLWIRIVSIFCQKIIFFCIVQNTSYFSLKFLPYIWNDYMLSVYEFQIFKILKIWFLKTKSILAHVPKTLSAFSTVRDLVFWYENGINCLCVYTIINRLFRNFSCSFFLRVLISAVELDRSLILGVKVTILGLNYNLAACSKRPT